MVEYPAKLDATYHALAHPVRLGMVRRLSQGPARVTELAEPFDVSLAAASKHIKALEAAGLVTRDIRGRDHVLSLKPANLVAAGDWIDKCRSFWESRLDMLAAQVEKKKK
jgi:DNA-binding transcriptional ArsR family regulator